MSSSVGYYVSAADREAQRQRELRAEIATMTAALARTRNRAAAAKVRVGKGSRLAGSRDGASSTELASEADALRDVLAQEQLELDRGLSEQLSQRIGQFSAVRSRTTDPVTELAHKRTLEPVADTHAVRERQRRRAAVADAANLLATSASSCDPSDLPRLSRLVEELSTLEHRSVAEVRGAALGVAAEITESVRRRKQADRIDEQRARLLSLAVDALPEDRQRLLDLISAADDPADLADQVHRSVHQADLAKERVRIAAAAMSALAQAGCAVGPDFATLLIDGEQAVVELDGEPDYGVLVRLPAEGGQLMAAVVRDDAELREPTISAAQRDQDIAAQQSFCDGVLPAVTSALNQGGVEVNPQAFLILEPGRRPVASAPPDRWSRPVDQRDRRRTKRVAQQPLRTLNNGS
jgi:hypothetical protein